MAPRGAARPSTVEILNPEGTERKAESGAAEGHRHLGHETLDTGVAAVNTGPTPRVRYDGPTEHGFRAARTWERAIGRDAAAMASGRDQEYGLTMEEVPESIGGPCRAGTV